MSVNQANVTSPLLIDKHLSPLAREHSVEIVILCTLIQTESMSLVILRGLKMDSATHDVNCLNSIT